MLDQHLDGGAGEGAEELELVPEDTVVTPEPGNDPLDDIKDPKARDEAKKSRAIARRLAAKPTVEPKPAVVSEPTTEYVTKADFYKANERKAIREATADPEIRANWDKIVPFFASRRGKETPEDIAEDIRDAITLFKARNPEVITDDSKYILTETSVVKTGGGVVTKTPAKPVNPPNFNLPAQPSDWYKPAAKKE